MLHGPCPAGCEKLSAAYGSVWDIYREKLRVATLGALQRALENQAAAAGQGGPSL